MLNTFLYTLISIAISCTQIYSNIYSKDCGKGGVYCSNPQERCIKKYIGGICTSGTCMHNNKSSCKIPPLADKECGKGGIGCSNPQEQCIQKLSNQYCVSGPCMYADLSECKIPPATLLPCGLGGNLCFEGKKCIDKNTKAECNSPNCYHNAECKFPLNINDIACGEGGIKCKSGQVCLNKDLNTECKEGDCVNDKSYSCHNPSVMPCGKGGIICDDEELCIDSKNSIPCLFGDCMKSKSTSCQTIRKLPCGQGGVNCHNQLKCILNDKSKIVAPEAIQDSLLASCQNPDVLPCGQGGTRCTDSKKCIRADNSALCKSNESCVNNNLSRCELPAVLPCGKGGIHCKDPLNKCIKKDNSALCLEGKCMEDNASSCKNPSVLPCGINGGTHCPSAANPMSEMKCLWTDPKTHEQTECKEEQLCTSNNIAKCQLVTTLPCGKGGLSCSGDNVCMLANQAEKCNSASCLNEPGLSCKNRSLLPCGKGGTSCPLSSNPTYQTYCVSSLLNTPPSICTSGDCMESSSCKNTIELLSCGQGGTKCPINQYCVTKDKKALCTSGDCMLHDSLCADLTHLPCGQGGDPCHIKTHNEVITTNPIKNPSGLSVGINGEFYIIDYSQNMLFSIKNGAIQFKKAIPSPKAIAFDAHKNRILVYSNKTLISLSNDFNTTEVMFEFSDWLNDPSDIHIATDSFSNIYISNADTHTISKLILNQNGKTYKAPSIIAGKKQQSGYSNNDLQGFNAINALLNQPSGIVVDQNGVIYIADKKNNMVRSLNPSSFDATCTSYTISTIIGDKNKNSDNDISIQEPESISVDHIGNLYISDTAHNRIVYMAKGTKNLYIIAGTSKSGVTTIDEDGLKTSFNSPAYLTTLQNNDLMLIDTKNKIIKKLTQISTH